MGVYKNTIENAIQDYDRDLYLDEGRDGLLIVMRKVDALHKSMVDSGPLAQPVFYLTEDFTMDTKPVPWGIEPVMTKLRSMDAWAVDFTYEDIRKKRERVKEDKERANRNELRARAADIRRDFAKATNDFVYRH